jgi:nucleoside-triphosphatase
MRTQKNILITGLPGVGKTTAIIRLARMLKYLNPAGFYTAEIREGGIRQGFELISLDGMRSLLSHVNKQSPHRVSKYGVDIAGFDTFLDSLQFENRETGLVIIDEIGKMECYSDKFKALVREILESDKPVIATIALKGGGFLSEVRKREDVSLVELTQTNRDSLAENISEQIKILMQKKDGL